MRCTLLENSSQVAVDTFGVFADHDEIEVFRFDTFERAKRRIQQAHWSHIGEEIHLAAHAEQYFSGVNIEGYAGIAKGSDEDGIEVAGQGGEAVGRDGSFVGEIAISSPVEGGEFDSGTRGLNDVYGMRDYFFADAVAGDHGYALFSGHVRNVSTGVGDADSRVSTGDRLSANRSLYRSL